MWVALFMGTGLLMCLYSMEWYARLNCPSSKVKFIIIFMSLGDTFSVVKIIIIRNASDAWYELK